MSCDNVQEQISSLLDRRIPADEQENVLAHIDSCRDCGAHYESMQKLREGLRSMNAAPMPVGLTARLRVLASHEQARQTVRVNLTARTREWRSRIKLVSDNLMRPVALPFAGGLLSAMLLFTMLVPSLSFAHNFFGDDPPSAIFTYPDGKVVGAVGYIPKIEFSSTPRSDNDTVLELTIDERGRVADYSLQNGQLTPDMKSMILWSTFTPATVFGQPTWSKVQVYFHSDIYSVNVKG